MTQEINTAKKSFNFNVMAYSVGKNFEALELRWYQIRVKRLPHGNVACTSVRNYLNIVRQKERC